MTDTHYMATALRKHGKMPVCQGSLWNGTVLTTHRPPWCTSDVGGRWLNIESTLAMWDTTKPRPGKAYYQAFAHDRVELAMGPHPVIFQSAPARGFVAEMKLPRRYNTGVPAALDHGPMEASFGPFFARKWHCEWTPAGVAAFMAALG